MKESREHITKQTPSEVSVIISAPGSEKGNTSIKADSETCSIIVYNDGVITSEELRRAKDKFDIDVSFHTEIFIDKRYDVTKANISFVCGYIMINIPANTERLVKLN